MIAVFPLLSYTVSVITRWSPSWSVGDAQDLAVGSGKDDFRNPMLLALGPGWRLLTRCRYRFGF